MAGREAVTGGHRGSQGVRLGSTDNLIYYATLTDRLVTQTVHIIAYKMLFLSSKNPTPSRLPEHNLNLTGKTLFLLEIFG